MKFVNEKELAAAANDGVISDTELGNYARYRRAIMTGVRLTPAMEKFQDEDLLRVQKALVHYCGHHYELALDVLKTKARVITGKRHPVVTNTEAFISTFDGEKWVGAAHREDGSSIPIVVTLADLKYI